jgi:FKBP-type peptidyl-prolyl cis-trans isomerase SlyD
MSMGQFCTMDITEQCVVALTWTLKDTLGEVLDVLDEPVEFLVGGDDLLPRIEQALQGHGPGARWICTSSPRRPSATSTTSCSFWSRAICSRRKLEEGMTIEGSALPKGTNPEAPRNACTPSPRSTPSTSCWTATTRWRALRSA